WWQGGIALSRERETKKRRLGRPVDFRGNIGTGNRIDSVDEQSPFLKNRGVSRVEHCESAERERSRRSELNTAQGRSGASLLVEVPLDPIKHLMIGNGTAIRDVGNLEPSHRHHAA